MNTVNLDTEPLDPNDPEYGEKMVARLLDKPYKPKAKPIIVPTSEAPPKEPDEHSTTEEVQAYMAYVPPDGHVSVMDLNVKERPMMRTGDNMMKRTPGIHRDMREPACRRYEVELAESCTFLLRTPGGFCEFDMAHYTMSAQTFANRIRSAATGFRRYGYPSKIIPQAFNLAWLTFSPTPSSVVVTVKPNCRQFVLEAYGSLPSE